MSNILLVTRKNKTRICLDPIPLNKALRRPNCQFTTIDEILPELGKAKVFSTVDTKKGFWHIKLNEQSSQLTTFWTPFGRYRWLRMPFGISSAPEIFHLKMQQVLQGLKGVEVLADDIIIFGCGENNIEAMKDHNKNLEKLLERLKIENCKLNREKLKLCQKSIRFYGHILTEDGLKADELKVKAIQDFPEPQDKKELQRFLGMITYLGRFIPKLSSEVSKLRHLLLEKENWNFGKQHLEEFNRIKKILTFSTTLKYFDKSKPITIECDASAYGLGAAIYQDNQPISFASRTLNPTERNYAQIEKELLSVVFACTRFDQYIVGNKNITIKTDHRPLISIFKQPLITTPKRLQRMLMVLQRYTPELQFVSGKDNIVADTLSRAPLSTDHTYIENNIKIYTLYTTTENDICKKLASINLDQQMRVSNDRLDKIRQITKADDCSQKIKGYILNGWPNTISQLPDDVKRYNQYRHELTIQNEIIYRNDRILIPFSLRKKITNLLHTSHTGIENTLKVARRNVFWPGMTSEIKNKIGACNICARVADNQRNPPMQSHSTPNYPFQFVSMDVLTAEFNNKSTKFLITVDHYSDFFELDILKNTTASETIKICQKNFSRHGIPETVCTDNGTNFNSSEFRDFAKFWKFTHVTSSPHHQRGNGKAEAAVKIAKRLIKTSNSNELWFNLLHHRNIPNKLDSAPTERLFSRCTRTTLPTAIKNLQPKIIKRVPEKIELNKQNSKFHFDRKTRNLPELQIGQQVNVQVQPEQTNKWSPGIIKDKLTDRSYLVACDKNTYRRNIVNIKPSMRYDEERGKEDPTSLLTSVADKPNQPTPETRVEEGREEDISNTDVVKGREEDISNTDVVKPTEYKVPNVLNKVPGIRERPKRLCQKPEKYKDYVCE